MGLLDSLINTASSMFLKDNDELKGKLSDVLTDLLAQVGGLSGLVQKFQSNGLGDIISSWMGEGKEILPVSEEQIHQVVGGDVLSNLAEKTGVDTGMLGSLLAKGLPNLVGFMSKEGESVNDLGHLDADTIKGLIGKLFS